MREYIGWKPKDRIKTSANLLSDWYGQTMLKLRKFLCWWFGLQTVTFSLPAFFTIFYFLRHGNSQGPSPAARSVVTLFAVFLLVVVPNGMAWWTVKHGKAFARGWAIVASIEMILMGLFPLVVLSLPAVSQRDSIQDRLQHLAVFILVFLVIGVTGLFVFCRRDSMAQTPADRVKPPRIAGDGTSRLLDGAAWLIGVGGYIGGRYLWVHWGHAHGLSADRRSDSLVLIVGALLITALLHEMGHASTGLALGMKLRMFVVGPFQWRIRDGRWQFKFVLSQAFSMGGATALVPTNPWQLRWREISMIAAGPVANLITGLIATVAALAAKGQPYERYWLILTIFSTLSLVTFVVNLIPFRPEAAYSDGARIYQLLGGGPWADLHRTFSIATSTLVTQLRPKDFDIDAIQRAELSFTQGNQALLLRLFAASYFTDRGMISQARDAVADAERIYQESASNISAELHTDFVFSSAYLRRDAAKARLWWERMEAKKPTHLGVDYWLAWSALCWIEDRQDEAREAWGKADSLARKLPAAGAYEFDRYRCGLLHDCIEKMEPSLKS
jgi:hypothetical protein